MQQSPALDLATFTTLRLGGPARRMVVAATAAEVIDAVTEADVQSDPVLVLGGGSNLVIADAGFDGTVVRITSSGMTVADQGATAKIVVAAGEPWDEVVAHAVESELSGLECLSGIPGSTGATPIQNVGAYGASVEDVITRVRVWDRDERRVLDLTPADCRFGYRTSGFKHVDRRVILEVEFALARTKLSAPIRYAELARSLDIAVGERAPLAVVRGRVLELRRGKGMVVDPGDPDSVSAGSFFTNPILDPAAFAALERTVAQRLGSDVHPPSWPDHDGYTKASAAWLIERAGFARGHGDGTIGLSRKHTLSIVNRGGGTTAELVEFARDIRDRVSEAFGVELTPEPTLVGVTI